MNIRCLNPQDKPFTKKAYKVTIGRFLDFNEMVFADTLAEAIDLIVDHWQETKGNNSGYFFTDEEMTQDNFSPDDYITGGNNSRVTTFKYDELRCEEFIADNVVLMAVIRGQK